MNTPELARLLTALFSAEEKPPPRDMFATAGLMRFTRTQSTPAMIAEYEPEPEQFNTRMPRSSAPLAMPYVLPPMVPATCVPWPLQSWPLPPSASYGLEARPPNCECDV